MQNPKLTTFQQPLPDLFLNRLADIVPAPHFEACCASFEMPLATAFRTNTLKAETEEIKNTLLQDGINAHSVSWFSDAFWIEPEKRSNLLQSDLFKQQKIYVQNLSSMVPPLLLNPCAHETILDLTAAPGSKTLLMACLMKQDAEKKGIEPNGHIAAVEVVRKRFFQLQANLKAQGATNVRTFLKDGAFVWKNRPEFFDKVLLDAPCSTEARFRMDDPETYRYWSLKKIKEMAYKQEKLLHSAIQCLRVGGELVYSTCSFAPEENEMILQKALNTFGDAIALVEMDLPFPNVQVPLSSWQGASFDTTIQHARRILPTHNMEGFFVAKWRKVGSTL